MKLSEIFTQLSYGELSQISLGSSEMGGIDEGNYPRLLAHINLGLLALYKRFPLKEGRTVLTLQPGVLTYSLGTENVLKVERIYTEQGWELGLNDEADPYACFTPSAHLLRVPAEVAARRMDLPDHLKTSTLEVVYRAGHPLLALDSLGYLDPEQVEVELPYSHLEPMLYYVASRVNNPMGMSNEFHAGNSYYAKYEAACQQLELQNLRVDQGAQNTRLDRNGWV